MSSANVLRVNAAEETDAYREAVAEVLRLIQVDHKITLAEIAERIDVSLGTVSNAANKKNDLNSIYLARLGQAFGAHCLDPYARLMGARLMPVQADGEGDILPLLLSTGTSIAQARCPSSPGGVSETLRERLGYLPYLRKLRREADALIHAIECEREAA